MNPDLFKILIQVLGGKRATEEVTDLNDQLNNLQQQDAAEQGGNDFKNFADRAKEAQEQIQSIAATYFLVQQAIQAVRNVAEGFYNSLIARNQELQDAVLATQTALAASQDIFRDGALVEGADAQVRALRGTVLQSIEEIRRATLSISGVTSSQVIEIFQNINQSAGDLGTTLEENQELAIAFAAGLTAFNVPLEQQRSEVRAILQGTIDRNAQLANSLGLTNELIAAERERGNLFEFILERLETAQAGQAIAARSIRGVFSNVQEFIQEIQRLTGEPLLRPIVETLNQILDLLTDVDEEGTRVLSSGLAEAAQTLGQGLADTFQIVRTTIGRLIGALDPIREAIANIFEDTTRADFQTQVQNIANTLERLFGLVGGILGLTDELLPVLRAGLAVYTVGLSEAVILLNNLGNALARAEVEARNADTAATQFDEAITQLREGIPLTESEFSNLEDQIRSSFDAGQADILIDALQRAQEEAVATTEAIELVQREQRDLLQEATEAVEESTARFERDNAARTLALRRRAANERDTEESLNQLRVNFINQQVANLRQLAAQQQAGSVERLQTESQAIDLLIEKEEILSGRRTQNLQEEADAFATYNEIVEQAVREQERLLAVNDAFASTSNSALQETGSLLAQINQQLEEGDLNREQRAQLLELQAEVTGQLAAQGIEVEDSLNRQLDTEQILANIELQRLEIQRQQLEIQREQEVIDARRRQREAQAQIVGAQATLATEGISQQQQVQALLQIQNATAELAAIPLELANTLQALNLQGQALATEQALQNILAGNDPGQRGQQLDAQQALEESGALAEANLLLGRSGEALEAIAQEFDPGALQGLSNVANQILGDQLGELRGINEKLAGVANLLDDLPERLPAATVTQGTDAGLPFADQNSNRLGGP